jgi:hypothetical protein
MRARRLELCLANDAAPLARAVSSLHLTRGTEQLNAIAVLQIRLGFVHVSDGDEERAVLDADRTQLIAPSCHQVRPSRPVVAIAIHSVLSSTSLQMPSILAITNLPANPMKLLDLCPRPVDASVRGSARE